MFTQLWKLRSKSTKATGSSTCTRLFKLINSHENAESRDVAEVANQKRIKQLHAFQRESAQMRRAHAAFVQQFPTKSEREVQAKQQRTEKRASTWSKYVEGLKKCLNPAVKELQADGKIRSANLERREGKALRGQENFLKSLKPATLMRRKYLAYLSTETLPNLVTASNLDAKIQEALDKPVSYNVNAEGVVEGEREVKRKLREIRVDMSEFEGVNMNMNKNSVSVKINSINDLDLARE